MKTFRIKNYWFSLLLNKIISFIWEASNTPLRCGGGSRLLGTWAQTIRFDPTLETNKQTTSIIILKWKLKYYLIALVFANSSLILIYTSLIVGHVLLQISTCRNAMTLATSLIYGFMHLSKGRSKEETEFLQASTGLNPRIFRIARQTFVIISDFFF